MVQSDPQTNTSASRALLEPTQYDLVTPRVFIVLRVYRMVHSVHVSVSWLLLETTNDG